MSDFEQYIRETEPHRREKGEAWQTAIGLQAVDGLKPSDYLVQTAKQHIEGDITIEEAKHLIDSYYQSKTVRHEQGEERTEETICVRLWTMISSKKSVFLIKACL